MKSLLYYQTEHTQHFWIATKTKINTFFLYCNKIYKSLHVILRNEQYKYTPPTPHVDCGMHVLTPDQFCDHEPLVIISAAI